MRRFTIVEILLAVADVFLGLLVAAHYWGWS